MYRIFFLLLLFSATLHAQPVANSSWRFINYNDGYNQYRGGNYGLHVSGDTLSTVFIAGDQVHYCISRDGGRHWKTEIVEDSTNALYANLPGVGVPWDSARWFYATYRHPLLDIWSECYGLSFVTDARGIPHLLYEVAYSQGNGIHEWLRHAWRENGKWKIEVVTEITNQRDIFNGGSALAVDAAGVVNILFSQQRSGVKFARKEKQSWTIQHIDTIAYSICLEIDRAGGFHCTMGTINGNCRYGFSGDNGKTWTLEQIPQTPWWEISLALSSDGVPHVVCRVPRGDLVYGVRKKKGWDMKMLVENDTVYHTRASILIDGCDRIHVSYFGGCADLTKANGLYYAYSDNDGKSWHFSVLDAKAHNGSSSGLAGTCISGNKIYFSYYLTDLSGRIAWKKLDCDPGDPLHG